MGNEKDKNRITEKIIIKGKKYIKDALNSRMIASLMAMKGSNVNVMTYKTIAVKTSSGFYA